MNPSTNLLSDQAIYRWSGLAGISGSFVFLIVLTIVIFWVGEDPTTLAGWVERYPAIRLARTAENSGYLLVLILWLPQFIGLFWALRRAHLPAALFGSSLAILGLTVMAAGALPHVATAPLAELYYSAEATAADQATLALMWQATWGIFDALLFAGLMMVAFGLTTVGMAMRHSAIFRPALARLTLLGGVASIAASVAQLIEPSASFGAIVVLLLVLLQFILGWRLVRLSQSGQQSSISELAIN